MVVTLALNKLYENIPALTQPMACMFEEVSIFCLESQGHTTGTQMAVRGTYPAEFIITWSYNTTNRAELCYTDNDDTTQWAACAISLLLIRELTQFTAVERTKKGPGIDYWLGDKDDLDDNFLAHKARLEVSGIRSGGDQEITKRLKQKIRQTDRSDDTNLPAFASVVEFSRPVSHVQRK